MADNEKTSARIAAIAAKALIRPQDISLKEIQELAGSVLTQAPDQKKPATKKKS